MTLAICKYCSRFFRAACGSKKIVDRTRSIKLGNPLRVETEMGPVAFKEQQDKIKHYISIAQEEGAQLVYRGKVPTDPELRQGFFIEPTIFTQVENQMRNEEVYGQLLGFTTERLEQLKQDGVI